MSIRIIVALGLLVFAISPRASAWVASDLRMTIAAGSTPATARYILAPWSNGVASGVAIWIGPEMPVTQETSEAKDLVLQDFNIALETGALTVIEQNGNVTLVSPSGTSLELRDQNRGFFEGLMASEEMSGSPALIEIRKLRADLALTLMSVNACLQAKGKPLQKAQSFFEFGFESLKKRYMAQISSLSELSSYICK